MIPFIQHRDAKLYVHQYPVMADRLEETVITSDAAAGASTLTVRMDDDVAGYNFSTSNILLLGEWGEQDAELVQIHASTAPANTTITLSAATNHAHNAGTKVYRLRYNRVALYHDATAKDANSTAPDTTLATVSLQPNKMVLTYDETAQTSGFYFARFNNSVASTFGRYTDALPFDGWTSVMVGHVIDYALRKNKTSFTEDITRHFCYEEIDACLKYIQGKQVHWDEQASMNAVLGQTVRGTHQYALSGLATEIYDNDSNKSIIAVRVGNDPNLIYKDPEEWEGDILGAVKFTQVRTAASAGATTLEIDNSYDFDDSGSVTVYVSGTAYTLTYTGVTRSATAGVLTGIPASGTGSITVTITVDTWVWQDEDEGKPKYFTVRNQNMEVWPLPDGSHDDMNITMDYWTVATEIDTDRDTLDVSQTYPVKYWLTAKVRAMKDTKGILKLDDPDWLLFKETLNDLIRTKRSAFRYPMGPRLNKISYN